MRLAEVVVSAGLIAEKRSVALSTVKVTLVVLGPAGVVTVTLRTPRPARRPTVKVVVIVLAVSPPNSAKESPSLSRGRWHTSPSSPSGGPTFRSPLFGEFDKGVGLAHFLATD